MLFHQRKQKGFTLIETIIGLVIIGILAAILTPFIQIYFQQNRLKGAAETLYDNMTLARTTAIQKASTVSIYFTTGASWCYGMSTAAIACTCSSAASATNCDLGIVTNADYPNTSISSMTLASPTTFNATRGALTTTAGNVIFQTTAGGTQSIQLTLSAMGTSTLCSSGGTVGGYVGC